MASNQSEGNLEGRQVSDTRFLTFLRIRHTASLLHGRGHIKYGPQNKVYREQQDPSSLVLSYKTKMKT